jgi:DNA-binding transcriptional MerR regulator
VQAMTIGEVSRRTGLAVSTIRYYQRRGLLPPREPDPGWQRFPPESVARLAVIELAKRSGCTLDEIAEFLSIMDTDPAPVPAWRALAQRKLADLDDQIARLHHMRDLLSEALSCSFLSLERAALIPAALGWATERAGMPPAGH